MLQITLALLGGALGLSFGADWFVSSASHFSRRFGISPVIIGLTVVAFGTSAPELAVSLLAAAQGNNEIAIGNVVGSNIFNVAFILGLCSLIKPLIVSSQLIRIDIPIMVAAFFALWGMAQDGQISKLEGAILFAGVIFYTFLQIKLAIKGKGADAQYEQEFSAKGNPLIDGTKLVVGLGLLIVGANYFVEGAILLARVLKMSEDVIALTIVAAGTSLPEVAASVAATLKGERDIAIGNVVGSNIFNVLSIIGITSFFTSDHLVVAEKMVNYDMVFMIALALLCMPLVIWRKQLDRAVGVMFFMSWIVYTWTLIK